MEAEKKTENPEINEESSDPGVRIIAAVMQFLQLFVSKTLAQHIVCLILLSVGTPDARISELTGYAERSVRRLRTNLKKGTPISELLHVGGGKPKTKTAGFEEAIFAEIDSNNYGTRREIADMIEKKFGITVSEATVGRLLKKNGLRRLKSGSLPAKADPQKQREYYDNELHPLMEQARQGKLTLLFMDAAHFVLGCGFLGYVWTRVRRFVTTFSGRKRRNVLAALDYSARKLLTVANDTYITATEVCEMLRKMAAVYAGQTIHVVLDNARYQKCQVVAELAAELGIALHYIPSYSPNLNLCERVWRFIKSELRKRAYDEYDKFIARIDELIDSMEGSNKKRIDKLIGEKVQLFDELQPICEHTYAAV